MNCATAWPSSLRASSPKWILHAISSSNMASGWSPLHTKKTAQPGRRSFPWRRSKLPLFTTCLPRARLKPSILEKPLWRTFFFRWWGCNYMSRIGVLIAGEWQRLRKYHLLTANLVLLLIWMIIASALDKAELMPFIPFIFLMDAAMMTMALVGTTIFYEKQE